MSFEQVPELKGAKAVFVTEGAKARRGAWKIPFVGVGPEMQVYSTTVRVALAGLCRRVLYRFNKTTRQYLERQVPSDELTSLRLGKFFQLVRSRVDVNVVRCALEKYPMYYSGGKRKTYERAVASLLRWPYDRVRDAMVKAFVKVEPTKLGADPRIIQTRSPRYHALLGTFVRPAEKVIYRAIDNIFGSRTIVKGLNAGQVGELINEKWNKFTAPVAVGLDASRFDGSVSEPLLKLVHGVLLHMYGEDPELAEYLNHQIKNFGVVPCDDGYIKYQVHGGVMSGDIDTSLKGCVIMCALVWSWSRHVGVDIELIDNGDDCVAIMETPELGRFVEGMSEWFKDLHIDVVAEEPVYVIEHISFCQTKPVLGSKGTYVMCRDFVTASVKDSMTMVNIASDIEFKRWMASVSSCGLALAGDMPIFHAMYECYGRSGNGENVERMARGGLAWLSRGMERRYGVTERTRFSFYLAYGIPPFVQREIESYFHSLLIPNRLKGPDEIVYPALFHAPESIRRLSQPW